MLFERQRYTEAEQVIHRLDSSQAPLTAVVARQESQIFALWGDFDRAVQLASAAYDPASQNYRDHVWYGQVMKLLARRAQREGHPEQLPDIVARAEKALRRASQIAPNAPDARVLLVQLLVATQQRPKALIAKSDAQEMIPLDVAPLAMAYIHEALGETEEAKQCYEKAFKLRPDLPLTIRLLAEFYVRNLDLKSAAPLVDKLLGGEVQAGESDRVAARRMKAAVLSSEGYSNLKQALALVDQNLASPLASPVASLQDKRLKLQLLLADPRQAHGPQVLELAAGIVNGTPAEPEPDDRFQLARVYLDRKDWKNCREQMDKLVTAPQTDPRYLAAYVRMLLDRDLLTMRGPGSIGWTAFPLRPPRDPPRRSDVPRQETGRACPTFSPPTSPATTRSSPRIRPTAPCWSPSCWSSSRAA